MRIQKAGQNKKLLRTLERRLMLDASLTNVAITGLVESGTDTVEDTNLSYETYDESVAWYDTAWDHRQKISVADSALDGDVSNFIMLITEDGMDSSFWSNVAESDGSDIIITDSAGNKLAREIVGFNSAGQTMEIHTKVNLTDNDGQTDDFYIYYGNSSSSEVLSDTGLWSDYEGVFHFEDTSGGTAIDSEGNDSNGTLLGGGGGPSATTGRIGQGLAFNGGSSQYVDFGADVGDFGTSDFSYSFWFTSTGAGGSLQGLVSKSLYNLGNDRFTTIFNGTDFESWVVSNSGGSIHYLESSNSGMSKSDYTDSGSAYNASTDWHYVTTTVDYDASTGNTVMRFYVDNVMLEENVTANSYNINNDYRLFMGVYNDGSGTGPRSGTYFTGQMDELRLSTEARDSAWIHASYENQRNPSSFYGTASVENYNIPANITYTVTDLVDSGTLFIDANANNTVDGGEALALNGTFTQADIDANKLRYVNTSAASSDSFTFNVSATTGESETAQTFTININDVNDAPTVSNGALSVDEDGSNTLDVMTLITDPDTAPANQAGPGDVTVNNNASHGTVTYNNSTGIITYAATTANYSGADSFTFTVNDGTGDITRTVNVTVNAVNDAPTIDTNTGMTMDEGATKVITMAMLNEGDADDSGAGLTYTASNLSNGVVRVNGSTQTTFTQADVDAGIVTFVHDGSETTTAGFSLSLEDGGEDSVSPATGSFNITVTPQNDAPTDIALSNASVNENVSVNTVVGTLSTTDADQPGDTFTYTITGGNTGGAFKIANGNELQVAAGIDHETLDSYTLTIQSHDGTVGYSKNFSITIADLNETPTIDTNIAQNVETGGELIITNAMLAGSDPDSADGPGDITYTASSLTNGIIQVSNVTQNTFTQADINAGNVKFVHDNSATNSASFAVSLSDGSLSDSATFNMTVNDTNDAPVIGTNTGMTMNEGSTKTITTAMLNEADPDDSGTGITYTVDAVSSNGTLQLSGSTLSVNDTFTQDDIDNNRITFVHGGNETTTASFDFTMADGGEDSVGTVSGTFNITVTAVNDATSVATNSGATVAEGGTANITSAILDASDPDDTAANITYTVTSQSAGTVQLNGANVGVNGTFTQEDIDNGDVTFVHDGSEANGSFGFDVEDDDNDGVSSQTFTVTRTPVNDAPVIGGTKTATMNEGASVVINNTMLAEADPDDSGTGLTYTASGLSNGVIQVNGSTQTTFTQADVDAGIVTFVHDGSETTTAGFSLSLEDGGEDSVSPDTDSFSITVNAVNDAPTVTNGTMTLNEGGLATLDVSTLITDAEGVAANQVTVNDNASQGTVSYNNTTGIITYTATDADYNGADSFTFVVNDGTGDVTRTVNVTLNPVNDAPVSGGTKAATVNEGASVVINNTMLSESDPDDSGAGLTYTASALTNGHIEVNGSTQTTFTQADVDAGIVTFVHDGSETNSASFNFSLADGGEDGVFPVTGQSFSFTVNPQNDTPQNFTLDTANIAEDAAGGSVIGTLSATDGDTGDTLTYSMQNDSSNKFEVVGNQLKLKAGQTLDRESTASYNLTLRVTDGTDPVDQAFTVTVTDVNDNAPTMATESWTFAEDGSVGDVVGSLTVTDLDSSNTNSFTITGGNVDGIFVIDNSGQVTIADTTSLDFETTESYSLTVQVNDGVQTANTTITIGIIDVSEASAGTNLVIILPEANDNTGVSAGDAPTSPAFEITQSTIQLISQALSGARSGTQAITAIDPGYNLISATVDGVQQQAFYGAQLQEIVRSGNTQEAARATMAFGQGGGYALEQNVEGGTIQVAGTVENVFERGEVNSNDPRGYEPAAGNFEGEDGFLSRFLNLSDEEAPGRATGFENGLEEENQEELNPLDALLPAVPEAGDNVEVIPSFFQGFEQQMQNASPDQAFEEQRQKKSEVLDELG